MKNSKSFITQNFTDVFKKHYADFSGRASQKQFWSYFALLIIGSIICNIIDYAIGFGIISFIYGALTLIPTLAIGARRLHDQGRTGWWQLLYLTGIGTFIVLIMMALPSKETL